MTTVFDFISTPTLPPNERRIANYLKALSDDLGDSSLLQRPMAMFRDTSGVITSVREINKIYFSMPKGAEILSEAAEEVVSAVKRTIERDRSTQVISINRNIRDYQNRLSTELAKLRDIGAADTNAIEQLRVSLSRFRPGFWELIPDYIGSQPFRVGTIAFRSQPINLVYQNKQINFGRLTFTLCYNKSLYLDPVRDGTENICLPQNTDCIHPFIVIGNICYGDQAPLESQLGANLDLTGLLELTRLLLTTYDHNSSPYRSLGDFYLNASRPDGTAPWRNLEPKAAPATTEITF